MAVQRRLGLSRIDDIELCSCENDRPHQQRIKIVVVRLTFAEPDEDVDQESLHSGNQLPLIHIQMLRAPTFALQAHIFPE